MQETKVSAGKARVGRDEVEREEGEVSGMSGWTLEVFPNDCSDCKETKREGAEGGGGRARKRRSIRQRTNDPCT